MQNNTSYTLPTDTRHAPDVPPSIESGSPPPVLTIMRSNAEPLAVPAQDASGGTLYAYTPATDTFSAQPPGAATPPSGILFHQDRSAGIRVEHRATDIACCVNGTPMDPGTRHALARGDVVAVGATALKIDHAPSQRPNGHDEPQHTDLIAVGNALPRTEAAHFGDLALLAEAPPAASPAARTRGSQNDPYSLLGNTLAHRPRPAPDEAESHDPLASLFDEYQHALIQHEGGHVHKHELKAIGQPKVSTPVPDDPFTGHAERYRDGSLLGDLLAGRSSIKNVLDEMNPFFADDLFRREPSHDVLHLLAPHGTAPQQFARTAPLTRQEHHVISADSHFPMLTAVTDTTQESA
jgi:hypothetical protein